MDPLWRMLTAARRAEVGVGAAAGAAEGQIASGSRRKMPVPSKAALTVVAVCAVP